MKQTKFKLIISGYKTNLNLQKLRNSCIKQYFTQIIKIIKQVQCMWSSTSKMKRNNK